MTLCKKHTQLKLLLTFLSIWFVHPPFIYAAAPAKRPPARVVTAPLIKKQVAPEIALTGSVIAEQQSRIAAELEGRVIKAPPKEGIFVKKGEILCRLNADILRYSLKIAKREIETATILLEKGELDFERVKPVFTSKATSKQAYDNRLFKLKEFSAKLEVAKVKCDRLKVEIEKKTIRAPFSGVIAEKCIEIGEWAAAGDTVCRLLDLNQLSALIQVPARYLPFINKKSLLAVRIGLEKNVIKCKLNRIVPSGNRKTRTFPVYLNLPPDSGLLPGLDLEIMVPTGKPQTALLAPRAAVVRKADKTYIVGTTDNQAQIIPVKISGYDGNFAVITPLKDQLAAGEPVVIRGNERLRPHQPISIIPANGEKKP